MATSITLSPDSLAALYGEAFYISPGDMPSTNALPITEGNVESKQVKAAAEPQAKVEPLPKTDPPKPRLEPVVTQQQPASKPGITWRPKPESKVLFVLQNSEFKDPSLTELLKKIVDSLGIPPASVGFGQIEGPVDLAEFDQMPNPHAVVFDSGVWGGADNPVRLGKGEVYFSYTLTQLQNDQDLKRQLWGHLKTLKEKLV